MKCYKCQGIGHISKNCQNSESGDGRKPPMGDSKQSFKPKV